MGLVEQVDVAELANLDPGRLLADEERIIADDAVLVLGEEVDDPPHLVADLDRTVIVRFDHNALVLGVGQGEARSVLADDAGDLLARRHRLTLGVDVVEVGRHLEREVGLCDDDRLAVLTRAHHVELTFAARTEVGDAVVTARLIHFNIPLLVLRLHVRSPPGTQCPE